MGIPFSKQINAAFDEVTPLVAAGFEVLQTTKNIAIWLAVIQVLTVIILSLVLLVLVAILISLNPDLETERQAIVTPVVQYGAQLAIRAQSNWRTWLIGAMVILLGVAVGATGGVWLTSKDFQRIAEEDTGPNETETENGAHENTGVDADEG